MQIMPKIDKVYTSAEEKSLQCINRLKYDFKFFYYVKI